MSESDVKQNEVLDRLFNALPEDKLAKLKEMVENGASDEEIEKLFKYSELSSKKLRGE